MISRKQELRWFSQRAATLSIKAGTLRVLMEDELGAAHPLVEQAEAVAGLTRKLAEGIEQERAK